jgi:pimeloyl-ACP methyl ester carboxylesterase
MFASGRLPVQVLGRLCLTASLLLASAPDSRAAEVATVATEHTVEELQLETSDGIRIAAWYYPAAEDATTNATVILIHDLEGSHATVENLARSLQRAGHAVVAPDLRGHGASGLRSGAGGVRGDTADPRLLKKADLEAITAATGGSHRGQAALRGEIEAVRGWIKQKSEAGSLTIDRLCVVGCGLGATLASMWTAADWNWPPTTSGPQGRQVRALALISPVWATKGVSMSLPLKSDAIQHSVPIMVLAGKGDREAIRLFDQLKRFRPNAWFQQRIEQPAEKARNPVAATDATVFFIETETSLKGDDLANDPALNVAGKIKVFIDLALAHTPE